METKKGSRMYIAGDTEERAAGFHPRRAGRRVARERRRMRGRAAAALLFSATVLYLFWGFQPNADRAAGGGLSGLSRAKLTLWRDLDAEHYPEGSYIPGEVVVLPRGGSLASLSRLLEEYGTLLEGDASRTLAAFAAGPVRRAARLRLRPGVDELETCRRLLSSDLVEAAEPNIIFHASYEPNDPLYSQQWNLWGVYGVRAVQAWDLQKGSSSLALAVIDTGVDSAHGDLAGRISRGYDYYNNDPYPWDDNGHGTLVSGIACAGADNHTDVAGVDWNAKVVPLKALNSAGAGSLDAVVQSVYYAASYAHVINMSLTSSAYSQILADALDYAHALGRVVVAAVGNEGSTLVNYPAGMTYALGVGSTGSGGVRSSFSNHNSSVDLVAPGESVWGLKLWGGSAMGNGTSEAAPQVAAAALLVLAEYSSYGLSPEEVWRLLRDGARDLGAPGYDYDYGWGLLDINASLRVPLVRITSPADYSYPASGNVSATAFTANESIEALHLSVDGAMVESYNPVVPSGTVTYTFSWDLSALDEGTHEVKVRAITQGGAYAGEHAVTVFRNHTQPQPSTDWYLAEGTTAWGFQEYVCVQNPNPSPVTAQVTFMKPGGATQYLEAFMVANSRLTINVNSLVLASDVSTHVHAALPVIVERAMYWDNRTDGHASTGANASSRDWYLAEGTTAWGFQEYIAVQNPNPAPTTLQVTFMKPGGATIPFTFYMEPNSRLTVPVNDLVPQSDLSTHVHADLPVIAERAMYWGGRDGGHGALGVLKPSPTWYFAEGSTAWGFEEWIVVQNPNPSYASLAIDLVNASGTRFRRTGSVAPYARYTLNVSEVAPESDISAFVSADRPVIAERAMYWSRNGRARAGGHCSTGSITACKTWYLAEGSTSWGFDEYIPLANISGDVAHATLTFMRTNGSTRDLRVSINAGARFTVFVNSVDPNRDASVRVESDRPLVVERAMYWSGKEGGTDTVGVLEP